MEMVPKGKIFTFKPSKGDEKFLKRIVGAQRWLWNYFLRLNITEYEKNKKFIFYSEMSKALPELKKEFLWLSEIPSQTLQQTLKRLDKALKSCFKSGFGFPKFQSRNIHDDSALFPQGFQIEQNRIRLPKIGWIEFQSRKTEIHKKHIRNITVRFDRNRTRWLVSVCYDDVAKALPATGKTVGLDAGSVRLATGSDGNFIPALRDFPKVQFWLSRIEKFQKKLSELLEMAKKETSYFLKRQIAKRKKDLNNAHRKLRNFCKDFLHKESRKIIERYDIIAVEDLKLKNMTRSAKGTIENPGSHVKQKSGLNRSLLSNRIAMFYKMLRYKAKWFGRKFLKVNPAYTSQTCSACGFSAKESRVSQAEFKCVHCGHQMNADCNAAINILKSALLNAELVAGS